MKHWYDNGDAISPIFMFSSDVRRVIYTTNAFESLYFTYRRLNDTNIFLAETALLKVHLGSNEEMDDADLQLG